MKWYIYGSDCNASYARVSRILDKFIKPNDEITLLERYGVNYEVQQYCKIHKINLHVRKEALPVNGVPVEAAFTAVDIRLADKCLFIFSQIEPPQLNFAYQIAINNVDISKICYDFI